MPDLAVDMRLEYLRFLVELQVDRENHYRELREYYDGDHPTQLTARMRKFLEVKSGQTFQGNYCPLVVDALAERLEITGIECEGQDEMLWDWWTAGGLDITQSIVHLATVRDGDGYLLVEWDDISNQPRMTSEPAYDGSEGVAVYYSAANRRNPERAVKRWLVPTGESGASLARMNVYYPGRVERYASQMGSSTMDATWQPYEDDESPAVSFWTTTGGEDGEPLGLPVIHFRNRDQGYSYGQAEHEDAMALQNAFNKALIDLLAAADTTGFRIYTATGIDASGLPVAPGVLWHTTDPDARFGVLEGEDLSKLIELKDSLAQDIARVTRTPLSYFQVTGQVQAEGTQKQQESALIAKAKYRQLTFGQSWADALRLTRRLGNTFGAGVNLDEAVPLQVRWRDPETRNEKEHLEGLKVKAELGVPQEQLWVEMGYDADAIERMKEMAGADTARSVESLAQGLLEQERRFDQGL